MHAAWAVTLLRAHQIPQRVVYFVSLTPHIKIYTSYVYVLYIHGVCHSPGWYHPIHLTASKGIPTLLRDNEKLLIIPRHTRQTRFLYDKRPVSFTAVWQTAPLSAKYDRSQQRITHCWVNGTPLISLTWFPMFNGNRKLHSEEWPRLNGNVSSKYVKIHSSISPEPKRDSIIEQGKKNSNSMLPKRLTRINDNSLHIDIKPADNIGPPVVHSILRARQRDASDIKPTNSNHRSPPTRLPSREYTYTANDCTRIKYTMDANVRVPSTLSEWGHSWCRTIILQVLSKNVSRITKPLLVPDKYYLLQKTEGSPNGY